MPMKTSLQKIGIAYAVAIVVLILAALVFIYSGVYHPGVTSPHSKVVEWLARTTLVNSVRTHARHITVPEDVTLRDWPKPSAALVITARLAAPAMAPPVRSPTRGWSFIRPRPT